MTPSCLKCCLNSGRGLASRRRTPRLGTDPTTFWAKLFVGNFNHLEIYNLPPIIAISNWPMTTPFEPHPFSFLQKVNSSLKLKRSITLDDIKEVLKQQHLLVRMSDRGLFIVLMTELIHHQFSIFLIRLKGLQAEICPPLKVPRKKR